MVREIKWLNDGIQVSARAEKGRVLKRQRGMISAVDLWLWPRISGLTARMVTSLLDIDRTTNIARRNINTMKIYQEIHRSTVNDERASELKVSDKPYWISSCYFLIPFVCWFQIHLQIPLNKGKKGLLLFFGSSFHWVSKITLKPHWLRLETTPCSLSAIFI